MESSVLMYRSGQGKVQVQVIFDTNTFWLSQQRMAELFGVDVRTVNYHLKQIDESGEIHLSDTIRKIRISSDKWSIKSRHLQFGKHLLFSIIRMRARTICSCNKKACKKRQNKQIANMRA